VAALLAKDFMAALYLFGGPEGGASLEWMRGQGAGLCLFDAAGGEAILGAANLDTATPGTKICRPTASLVLRDRNKNVILEVPQ
jgi:hypothetical protein